MKRKLDGNVVAHLLVIVVVGLGLWAARSWPYETGLFPRTIGGIVIIVTVISLIVEQLKKRRPAEGVEAAEAAPALPPDTVKKALIAFGWLAGYIFGIWLFGYVAASLLYAFLYMKFKGKQRWLATILVVAGAFLFMWAVFGLLLGIRWFPGAVWAWFGL